MDHLIEEQEDACKTLTIHANAKRSAEMVILLKMPRDEAESKAEAEDEALASSRVGNLIYDEDGNAVGTTEYATPSLPKRTIAQSQQIYALTQEIMEDKGISSDDVDEANRVLQGRKPIRPAADHKGS